jgi:hypothetical protein
VSFSQAYSKLSKSQHFDQCMATTSSQVDMALAGSLRGLDRLTALLSPAASKRLEELGQLSLNHPTTFRQGYSTVRAPIPFQ